MKFIQMMDQPVEPGGLVEWSPYTDGGLAHWKADSRPTSHNHEQHLRSAFEYRLRHRREGGRESWLGLAIDFDEPLSIPAIRSTFSMWIDRHEVLRSHVVIWADRLARMTTPPGSVKLKMGKVGWYGEPGPLLDQLSGTFDRATAPLQWPAYIFATVARERSFTLLFAADHSLVDGYSLIMAQHELVSLYGASRRKVPPELPAVGSYVDFSAYQRREADAAGSDHEAIAVWSDFLRDTGGTLPGFELGDDAEAEPDGEQLGQASDAGEHAELTPQGSITAELLDDDQTNRFTAVCSAAGGSLFAGVMAALGAVYADLGGGPVLRCVIPRHTRGDQQWFGALGWFVATVPFRLDSSQAADFGQAIGRATDELRRVRKAANLPFLRVGEILGQDFDFPEPKFVVSFIDLRFAPGNAEADAGRARVLRSHIYSADEVYIWVNRTASGLRISARFPSHGRTHNQVARFLGAFGDFVTAIGDQSTYGKVTRE
ncbi:condensation domain-containing protein [Williamsia limnetica]|uniref:Condensation domain-containing protein n=1 Tax=Williamsia limnetica TaxID=882452 RepID=A0A318RIE4_WILLI|nr:condensation domain-containing protein [Williamsia limnetica]PYE14726.1 condensation domain-containing protein [Williamsia limnetica]